MSRLELSVVVTTNEKFITLDACLYRYDIPVELRAIVKKYFHLPYINDSSIIQYIAANEDPEYFEKNYRKFSLLYGPIEYLDTSLVTHLNFVFRNYQSMDLDLSRWNTENVTSMSGMFSQTTFIRSPNISGWDVSKVKYMDMMFQECRNFNEPLNNWNTKALVDASEMFDSCTDFNQSLENWDTSSLKEARGMFKNNEQMAFDWAIENWDTGKLVNAQSMFERCTQFNRPIGNWDVHDISYCKFMFKDCVNFNQPLTDWTLSPNTMEGMFQNCQRFNQPVNHFYVTNVNNFDSVFEGASNFNQPLNKWKLRFPCACRKMLKQCLSFQQALPTIFFYSKAFLNHIDEWWINMVEGCVLLSEDSVSNDNLRKFCEDAKLSLDQMHLIIGFRRRERIIIDLTNDEEA